MRITDDARVAFGTGEFGTPLIGLVCGDHPQHAFTHGRAVVSMPVEDFERDPSHSWELMHEMLEDVASKEPECPKSPFEMLLVEESSHG